MSDFFAGVYGARFPDVVINGGGNPLPGMGGLPKPLHDTPDGKINYNSSLLGDLEPYAYGEPGYLSSQTSYLNIPHRIQKLVPSLWLPETDGTGSFRLDHPIDDGDIAFAMRLDRNSEVCTGLRNKSLLRSGLGTAIDPMINICTLNYILAGMQICTQLDSTRVAWDRLFNYLDKDRFPGPVVAGAVPHQYNHDDLRYVVRHLCRPFGVAHGSEKQGGQHEGSMAPVTWPVNFVISLVLDGKDANVVNIWHRFNVEAGSDLVLRLKLVPLPPGNKYTLNHFPKALREKTFSSNLLDQIALAPNGHRFTHIWQLVPDLFNLDMEPNLDPQHMHPNFVPVRPNYVWQQEGYWHIARAQIHCKNYGTEEYYYNDLANMLRTGHMDLTFQPTYLAVPYRDPAQPVGVAVHAANGRNVYNMIGKEMQFGSSGGDGGAFGGSIGGSLGDGGKRSWSHSLRLEKGFDASMGGQNNQHAHNFTRTVTLNYDSLRPAAVADEFSSGPNKRVRFVKIKEFPSDTADAGASVAASARSSKQSASNPPGFSFDSVPSGITEDIGIMEDAGSLYSSISAPPAADSMDHGDLHADSAPPRFSVPKPGLKSSAKRGTQRGKGVMGAVLASDGTVTHEPSRML